MSWRHRGISPLHGQSMVWMRADVWRHWALHHLKPKVRKKTRPLQISQKIEGAEKGLAVNKRLQKFLCYCHNMVRRNVPLMRGIFFPFNLYKYKESPEDLARDLHQEQKGQPAAH